LAAAALPTPLAKPTSQPAEQPSATKIAKPLPPAVMPQAKPATPAPIAQIPTEGSDAAHKPTSTPMVDVPSPLDLRHNLQEYRQLSDRQLMAELETAPRFEAAAMRKILADRGYTEQMLTLTRELQRLPASQRLEAIERAATLPTSEALLLLRWFLADDDADVRMQALTTLATSGDPKMAEIARRCAVEDADPRVAELASKLLKQR
jgi:hypothetical protein